MIPKDIRGYALINPKGQFHGLATYCEGSAWEQIVGERSLNKAPIFVIETLLKLQKEGWKVVEVTQKLEPPPDPSKEGGEA